MNIKVSVFAGLKEFFAPEFELEVPEASNISDLVTILVQKKSPAGTLLNKCRFAVEQEFVSADYSIINNDHVYLLPPSSGG